MGDNGKVAELEKGVSLELVDGDEAEELEEMMGKRGVSFSAFAAKKTVAQGMMDIALITANANQLRYLLEFQRNSPTFYLTLTLIVVSLILQVIVGVVLIFKRKMDLKGQEKLEFANKMNNWVVTCMFFITVINVFIAAFSITGDVPIRAIPTLPPP